MHVNCSQVVKIGERAAELTQPLLLCKLVATQSQSQLANTPMYNLGIFGFVQVHLGTHRSKKNKKVQLSDAKKMQMMHDQSLSLPPQDCQ